MPQSARLNFPSGYAPGFDPTHPAARGISGGHGFSGIASEANFINILTGKAGALSGAPTKSINGLIGPATTYPSSTNSSTFAGQATTNDTDVTIAGIFINPGTSINNHSFFVTSSSNTGWNLGTAAYTTPQITAGGVSSKSGSAVMSIGGSYFVVASISASASVFVVTELSTGKIFSTTSTGIASPSAPDGTYVVGSNNFANTQWSTPLAAVMFAPSFSSLQTLVDWASDPWSFWYPSR